MGNCQEDIYIFSAIGLQDLTQQLHPVVVREKFVCQKRGTRRYFIFSGWEVTPIAFRWEGDVK